MLVSEKQRLPRPLKCDACGSPEVELCNNKVLLGEAKGEWPLIYYCTECQAAVHCHPNTDHPMGLMADRQTRRLRGQAHKQFDKLWRENLTDRDSAYRELAQHLMIDTEACHISMFNAEQCKLAIAFAKQRLHELKQLSRGIVYRAGKRTKRNY